MIKAVLLKLPRRKIWERVLMEGTDADVVDQQVKSRMSERFVFSPWNSERSDSINSHSVCSTATCIHQPSLYFGGPAPFTFVLWHLIFSAAAEHRVRPDRTSRDGCNHDVTLVIPCCQNWCQHFRDTQGSLMETTNLRLKKNSLTNTCIHTSYFLLFTSLAQLLQLNASYWLMSEISHTSTPLNKPLWCFMQLLPERVESKVKTIKKRVHCCTLLMWKANWFIIKQPP